LDIKRRGPHAALLRPENIASQIFLPATLIICSITSLATGSSWGTSGTIGIALIGIGDGLGFPLPVVAGAVLSGAYFGDKMSPLSDTTNMAPAMVGTDLYTHIKHMTYTTGVSYGLTLIIEIALGFVYGGGEANLGKRQPDLDRHRRPIQRQSAIAASSG
jgi:NhaC family Na+:H+ antiporter